MLRRSVRILVLAKGFNTQNLRRKFASVKKNSPQTNIATPSKLTKLFNFGVKHGTNVITWVPLLIRDGPKIAISLAICCGVGYLYYLKKSYEEKYLQIKTTVSDRYNKVVDSISSKISSIKNTCTSSMSKVGSYAKDSYHKSVESVGNIFTKSKEILGTLNPLPLLKDKATSMKIKTNEIFQSALNKLKFPQKLKDSPEKDENKDSIVNKINPLPFLKEKSSNMKEKVIKVKDKTVEKVKNVKDKVLNKNENETTPVNQQQRTQQQDTSQQVSNNTSTTNTTENTSNESNKPVVGVINKMKDKWSEKLHNFKTTKTTTSVEQQQQQQQQQAVDKKMEENGK